MNFSSYGPSEIIGQEDVIYTEPKKEIITVTMYQTDEIGEPIKDVEGAPVIDPQKSGTGERFIPTATSDPNDPRTLWYYEWMAQKQKVNGGMGMGAILLIGGLGLGAFMLLRGGG